MKKFVVYGANRSGSHFLQSLLDSHPNINCFWDIFWKQGRTPYCLHSYLSSKNLARLPRFFGRRKIIFDFLNDHYAKSSDMEAAGFLLKWGATEKYPEILAWLEENNVKIIHIVRENLLVHQIAFQLRNSGIVKNHARIPIEFSKVRMDVDKLLPRLRWAKKAMVKKRKQIENQMVMEVQYEKLLFHESKAIADILEFLKMEKCFNLVSLFKKTESESPREMIENYDQVYNLLKDTEFGIYLD